MELMIKSTPVSTAYDAFVKAGRKVNQVKRSVKPKKSKGKANISMCIGKMMLAGTNTFSQMAMGACIPDGNTIASIRSFVKRQITVVIGTNGVGFLHCFHPLQNGGIAFASTQTTFTGLNGAWLSADNTLAVGVTTHTLSTPYESGDFTNGWSNIDSRAAIAGRIVGAGMTIRYTGKEIDRAGQIYAYTQPVHESSASGRDLNGTEVIFGQGEYAAFVETFICETAREDTCIPMFPMDDQELEFSNDSAHNTTGILYPWSSGANIQPGGFHYTPPLPAAQDRVGIPTTTVLFVGTPGSSFVINYGQHMEFVGLGTNGFSKFPSESDPVGVRDLVGAAAHFALNRRRAPGANATNEFQASIKAIQDSRASRFRDFPSMADEAKYW